MWRNNVGSAQVAASRRDASDGIVLVIGPGLLVAPYASVARRVVVQDLNSGIQRPHVVGRSCCKLVDGAVVCCRVKRSEYLGRAHFWMR